MEVVVASPSPPGSPTMDPFDFNGARISPYLSAPSSPKRFGEYYLSAPTSPSRLTEFYSDFDYFSSATPSNPFDWEHKPGTPKHKSSATNNNADDGFAFFVSAESEKLPSRSAEELFDGGKIKPLKDDDLHESARSPLLSPARAHTQPKRSPIAQGKKAIREAFSPRKKKDTGGDAFGSSSGEERRGRDRTPAGSISSSSRRVTRSLSPYRVSHYTWEEEQQNQQNHGGNKKEDSNKGSSSSALSSKSSSRKWRLRDFLLFRSASEGRGTSKDPFRKYPASSFKKSEDGKGSSSSFRNSEIPPRSRRKDPVSAHELHYARKKAETEDLKKRTFLPYKQGILGRLAGFGL